MAASNEIRLVIEDDKESTIDIAFSARQWFLELYRKKDKKISEYVTIEERIKARESAEEYICRSVKELLDNEASFLWALICREDKRREAVFAGYKNYKKEWLELIEGELAYFESQISDQKSEFEATRKKWALLKEKIQGPDFLF